MAHLFLATSSLLAWAALSRRCCSSLCCWSRLASSIFLSLILSNARYVSSWDIRKRSMNSLMPSCLFVRLVGLLASFCFTCEITTTSLTAALTSGFLPSCTGKMRFWAFRRHCCWNRGVLASVVLISYRRIVILSCFPLYFTTSPATRSV